jgi:hypothetical protein
MILEPAHVNRFAHLSFINISKTLLSGGRPCQQKNKNLLYGNEKNIILN